MRDRPVWKAVYYAWTLPYVLVAIGTAALAGALKQDLNSLPPLLEWARSWIASLQQAAWWLGPAMMGVAACTRFMRAQLRHPRVWSVLHTVLDQYRDDVFKGLGGSASDHRITLFKYTPFHSCGRWPWSGWLVPVIRSGHITQCTTSVFRAPDNPTEAEGVAGIAWCGGEGGTFVPEGLPILSPGSDDTEFQTFADLTNMPLKKVRADFKRKRLRSSYGAFPVETKQGKPWGIVVLDSRDPNGVTMKTKRRFGRMAQELGSILKGAGA